ncbi:MAG: hypothetical protein Q8908_07195, partial [Bacteroidota bacterium]|nr:hypothetical protein [Bacteroidota bacterium]
MRKNIFILSLLLIVTYSALAQKNLSSIKDPLEVVKLLGDKLIRDTPFKYKLIVAPINQKFDNIRFIDFGR